MTTDTLYIYALMRAADVDKPSFPTVERADAPIVTLDCGPIRIIASAVEGAVAETPENIAAHNLAIATVAAGGPVLPVEFGCIAAKDGAEAAVAPYVDRIAWILDDLADCVEVGVEIVWNQALVMDELIRETDELAKVRAALSGREACRSEVERAEFERRVQHLLREKRSVERLQYNLRLSASARDRVIREIDDPSVVLKADYLVELAREADLRATLDEIVARTPGRLQMSYTSSSPAGLVVTLRLDWSSPADGDPADQAAGDAAASDAVGLNSMPLAS